MITSTTTKTLFNATNNSIDFSYKTSKADGSYESTYSKNFKDVLNSKSSSNDVNTKKASDADENNSSIEDKNATKVDSDDTTRVDSNDTDKIDELKNKLEKLEVDSKSDSKDKVNDILTELMNLLAKLGISKSDITNGKVDTAELNTLMEGVSGDKTSNSVMDKLMKLLQTKSVTDKLDADSLNSIKNILGNLSNSIKDNRSNANGIKDLVSEISNMIDNKQNQNGKVSTLEDLLNKNYSQNNQDNKENSSENENSNSKTSLDNKNTSKEDKFLSSLIDDNKDKSVDKINLFASRSQIIQNQGVDVTKNPTINKATFVDDLISDVKYMSNNGLKELTVKINPGNLGEITINLTQEDGVMKANLKANSKDTANLLIQNLADIKNQLNDKNIKIDDVNIELYQDDTTFFSNQGSNGQLAQEKQKNSGSINNENGEATTDDNMTENIQTISNGNLNFLA
ncbi:flagellar hook-length control protein FliK [Clostridium sp.]|uniref:flagellar hook-length control protein FliK n=1 Tax=Clostridium sp. TaxID=1506 RepID=UPI002841E9B2|nr:flagellar hook-length control protein FliK [Clostridium sp.]MDR3594008.1 flagellar hook-length control protein FliK [Clostridium sp.]